MLLGRIWLKKLKNKNCTKKEEILIRKEYIFLAKLIRTHTTKTCNNLPKKQTKQKKKHQSDSETKCSEQPQSWYSVTT